MASLSQHSNSIRERSLLIAFGKGVGKIIGGGKCGVEIRGHDNLKGVAGGVLKISRKDRPSIF